MKKLTIHLERIKIPENVDNHKLSLNNKGKELNDSKILLSCHNYSLPDRPGVARLATKESTLSLSSKNLPKYKLTPVSNESKIRLRERDALPKFLFEKESNQNLPKKKITANDTKHVEMAPPIFVPNYFKNFDSMINVDPSLGKYHIMFKGMQPSKIERGAIKQELLLLLQLIAHKLDDDYIDRKVRNLIKNKVSQMKAKASLGKYLDIGEATIDAGLFFDIANIAFKDSQIALNDLKTFELIFYSTFTEFLSLNSALSSIIESQDPKVPGHFNQARYNSILKYPYNLRIDPNHPDCQNIAMQAIEQFHSKANWSELIPIHHTNLYVQNNSNLIQPSALPLPSTNNTFHVYSPHISNNTMQPLNITQSSYSQQLMYAHTGSNLNVPVVENEKDMNTFNTNMEQNIIRGKGCPVDYKKYLRYLVTKHLDKTVTFSFQKRDKLEFVIKQASFMFPDKEGIRTHIRDILKYSKRAINRKLSKGTPRIDQIMRQYNNTGVLENQQHPYIDNGHFSLNYQSPPTIQPLSSNVGHTPTSSYNSESIVSPNIISAQNRIVGANIASPNIISAQNRIVGANIASPNNFNMQNSVVGANIVSPNNLTIFGANIASSNNLTTQNNIVGANIVSPNNLNTQNNLVGEIIVSPNNFNMQNNIVGANIVSPNNFNMQNNIVGEFIVSPNNLNTQNNIVGEIIVSPNNLTTQNDIVGASNTLSPKDINIQNSTIIGAEKSGDQKINERPESKRFKISPDVEQLTLPPGINPLSDKGKLYALYNHVTSQKDRDGNNICCHLLDFYENKTSTNASKDSQINLRLISTKIRAGWYRKLHELYKELIYLLNRVIILCKIQSLAGMDAYYLKHIIEAKYKKLRQEDTVVSLTDSESEVGLSPDGSEHAVLSDHAYPIKLRHSNRIRNNSVIDEYNSKQEKTTQNNKPQAPLKFFQLLEAIIDSNSRRIIETCYHIPPNLNPLIDKTMFTSLFGIKQRLANNEFASLAELANATLCVLHVYLSQYPPESQNFKDVEMLANFVKNQFFKQTKIHMPTCRNSPKIFKLPFNKGNFVLAAHAADFLGYSYNYAFQKYKINQTTPTDIRAMVSQGLNMTYFPVASMISYNEILRPIQSKINAHKKYPLLTPFSSSSQTNLSIGNLHSPRVKQKKIILKQTPNTDDLILFASSTSQNSDFNSTKIKSKKMAGNDYTYSGNSIEINSDENTLIPGSDLAHFEKKTSVAVFNFPSLAFQNYVVKSDICVKAGFSNKMFNKIFCEVQQVKAGSVEIEYLFKTYKIILQKNEPATLIPLSNVDNITKLINEGMTGLNLLANLFNGDILPKNVKKGKIPYALSTKLPHFIDIAGQTYFLVRHLMIRLEISLQAMMCGIGFNIVQFDLTEGVLAIQDWDTVLKTIQRDHTYIERLLCVYDNKLEKTFNNIQEAPLHGKGKVGTYLLKLMQGGINLSPTSTYHNPNENSKVIQNEMITISSDEESKSSPIRLQPKLYQLSQQRDKYISVVDLAQYLGKTEREVEYMFLSYIQSVTMDSEQELLNQQNFPKSSFSSNQSTKFISYQRVKHLFTTGTESNAPTAEPIIDNSNGNQLVSQTIPKLWTIKGMKGKYILLEDLAKHINFPIHEAESLFKVVICPIKSDTSKADLISKGFDPVKFELQQANFIEYSHVKWIIDNNTKNNNNKNDNDNYSSNSESESSSSSKNSNDWSEKSKQINQIQRSQNSATNPKLKPCSVVINKLKSSEYNRSVNRNSIITFQHLKTTVKIQINRDYILQKPAFSLTLYYFDQDYNIIVLSDLAEFIGVSAPCMLSFLKYEVIDFYSAKHADRAKQTMFIQYFSEIKKQQPSATLNIKTTILLITENAAIGLIIKLRDMGFRGDKLLKICQLIINSSTSNISIKLNKNENRAFKLRSPAHSRKEILKSSELDTKPKMINTATWKMQRGGKIKFLTSYAVLGHEGNWVSIQELSDYLEISFMFIHENLKSWKIQLEGYCIDESVLQNCSYYLPENLVRNLIILKNRGKNTKIIKSNIIKKKKLPFISHLNAKSTTDNIHKADNDDVMENVSTNEHEEDLSACTESINKLKRPHIPQMSNDIIGSVIANSDTVTSSDPDVELSLPTSKRPCLMENDKSHRQANVYKSYSFSVIDMLETQSENSLYSSPVAFEYKIRTLPIKGNQLKIAIPWNWESLISNTSLAQPKLGILPLSANYWLSVQQLASYLKLEDEEIKITFGDAGGPCPTFFFQSQSCDSVDDYIIQVTYNLCLFIALRRIGIPKYYLWPMYFACGVLANPSEPISCSMDASLNEIDGNIDDYAIENVTSKKYIIKLAINKSNMEARKSKNKAIIDSINTYKMPGFSEKYCMVEELAVRMQVSAYDLLRLQGIVVYREFKQANANPNCLKTKKLSFNLIRYRALQTLLDIFALGISGVSTLEILKARRRHRKGHTFLHNQVNIMKNKKELDFSDFCKNCNNSPPIRIWILPNKESVLSLLEVSLYLNVSLAVLTDCYKHSLYQIRLFSVEYLYLKSQGFLHETENDFAEPFLFLNSKHYDHILQLKQLSVNKLNELLSYKATNWSQKTLEGDCKQLTEYKIKTFKFDGTTIKLLVTGDKILSSTELTVYKLPLATHPYMVSMQQFEDMFRCTPYNQLVMLLKSMGIMPRNPTLLEAAIISIQNCSLVSDNLNETKLIPYTDDIETLLTMIWLGANPKALFKYLTEIRPNSKFEEEITALGISTFTKTSWIKEHTDWKLQHDPLFFDLSKPSCYRFIQVCRPSAPQFLSTATQHKYMYPFWLWRVSTADNSYWVSVRELNTYKMETPINKTTGVLSLSSEGNFLETQGFSGCEDQVSEFIPLQSLNSALSLYRDRFSILFSQRVASVIDRGIAIHTFSTEGGDIKLVTLIEEQQKIHLRQYEIISSKESNRIQFVSLAQLLSHCSSDANKSLIVDYLRDQDSIYKLPERECNCHIQNFQWVGSDESDGGNDEEQLKFSPSRITYQKFITWPSANVLAKLIEIGCILNCKKMLRLHWKLMKLSNLTSAFNMSRGAEVWYFTGDSTELSQIEDIAEQIISPTGSINNEKFELTWIRSPGETTPPDFKNLAPNNNNENHKTHEDEIDLASKLVEKQEPTGENNIIEADGDC